MDTTSWEGKLVLPVSPRRDHLRGAATAPLMLLEYGDYECAYCGAAHPIVKAIEAQLGKLLTFAFRHFPLTTVHPLAETAAEAAEGAGAQGKFWSMHDLLYANQPNLAPPHLVGYAQALGLDLARFNAELAGGLHAAKVREDFISGVRSGVNGTPTFYINGRRHDGPWDYANLLAALQRAAGLVVEA
jgi:protein-disulfide isomerase